MYIETMKMYIGLIKTKMNIMYFTYIKRVIADNKLCVKIIRCTENCINVHKPQSHLKYNTITNTPYSTILYPITN